MHRAFKEDLHGNGKAVLHYFLLKFWSVSTFIFKKNNISLNLTQFFIWFIIATLVKNFRDPENGKAVLVGPYQGSQNWEFVSNFCPLSAEWLLANHLTSLSLFLQQYEGNLKNHPISMANTRRMLLIQKMNTFYISFHCLHRKPMEKVLLSPPF